MKWVSAWTLSALPGFVFVIALIFAGPRLPLPSLAQRLVEIFITILGVLLGFWSVTVSARIPKGIRTKPEEAKTLLKVRFWVAYILVLCIVASLILYLFLSFLAIFNLILLLVSGMTFYLGLYVFVVGYLLESGLIEYKEQR